MTSLESRRRRNPFTWLAAAAAAAVLAIGALVWSPWESDQRPLVCHRAGPPGQGRPALRADRRRRSGDDRAQQLPRQGRDHRRQHAGGPGGQGLPGLVQQPDRAWSARGHAAQARPRRWQWCSTATPRGARLPGSPSNPRAAPRADERARWRSSPSAEAPCLADCRAAASRPQPAPAPPRRPHTRLGARPVGHDVGEPELVRSADHLLEQVHALQRENRGSRRARGSGRRGSVRSAPASEASSSSRAASS